MRKSDLLAPDAQTRVKTYLLDLQKTICASVENLDVSVSFNEDAWSRPDGGGGITKTLKQGKIFAKAGVNFSHVYGHKLPPSATAMRADLTDCSFNALGISVVIHPENPYVPTTHANVRFFIAESNDRPPLWWFGGGFDLTPYYGFVEDCKHWHQSAKEACLPFGVKLYQQLKQQCDTYFYLKHRAEARGIGGLFFDDFQEGGFENSFALMQSVGNHFLKGYLPIVQRRKDTPYGEKEKAFQLYRRGRYVEFNLIYDRGTLFGLQSGGRTESILVSLPPEVHWDYNWRPEKGSEEEKLYTYYLEAKDWLNE